MKIINHRFLKIFCISIYFLLNGVTHVFARSDASMPGEKPALGSLSLVDEFYKERNSKLFWFGSADELRGRLISIIDSAIFFGLNKDKYHIAQLRAANNKVEEDSIRLLQSDRLYTETLILFCRDIYEGADIDKLLGFDELSSEYEKVSNEYILRVIRSIRTSSDLDSAIKGLEPTDKYFRVLKSELRTQFNLNNFSKIKQLSTSLDLHRWLHHFNFEKYIVVNIPSATLKYYEQNTEVLTSKVIVGKPSTPTPRFAAYCNMAIFYPYWTVPRSIAVKELFPRFKRSPAEVDKMNMEVIDRNGKVIDPYSIKWARYNKNNFPYVFRQSTGCDNSLGIIKFNLTDPFSVYLHDTNTKKLFASTRRYFSHGCIRVEKAIALGNYLLPGKIDETFLNSCLRDQKPIETQLARPVPVFVIYSTIELDEHGSVQYLKDVYNLFR